MRPLRVVPHDNRKLEERSLKGEKYKQLKKSGGGGGTRNSLTCFSPSGQRLPTDKKRVLVQILI